MPGTRCVSGRELRQMYEKLGARKTVEHLTEALQTKKLKPSDFSIRDLAENCVKNGREWVKSMTPGKGGYHLLEAGTVDYSAFSNITGQIFFTQVLEAYQDEQFVFTKMVKEVDTPIQDVEKVPGIGNIGDMFDEPVKEGDPYPYVGVVEDYIELGALRKRGGIIAVTKEAVLGDRTGMLMDRCNQIGYYLGVNKEARIIDTLIDGAKMARSIYAGGSRHHWKGTSYAAYQSSTPWINLKTSNALADWTDVEAVELLLAAITDPYTGLPVMIQPTTVIVPPDLKHTAQRIMTATNVQTHSGGYPTNATVQDYHAPSPLDPYKVVSSRLFKQRVANAVTNHSYTGAAATTWFLGNPEKAITYRRMWNVQVTPMGAGSEEEFTRDVVHRIKVSEFGHPGWLNPRLMGKSNA